MIGYNYIDESLEQEINNLELSEDINVKIDKDYELNFSEDEIFKEENNKDFIRSPKKIKKNTNTKKTEISNIKYDVELDEEFDNYMNELDRKIKEDVLREELEKDQVHLKLNTNIINVGNGNDKEKALKIIEEDPAIRNAIENKLLTFDDIVSYVDYYQLFTFINKSQRLALDQFSRIAELCEKESFVETEDDIKKRIGNTLKITDKILGEDKFDAKEIVFLDQKKRFFEEKAREDQKKKNEKDYLYKKSEMDSKNFLKELILTTRDKHIEIDDVYENIQHNANKFIYNDQDQIEELEKDIDQNKVINKIDAHDVEEIIENDKEYKFLENITKNENYQINLKIEDGKNKNRLFFIEKDLEDMENLKIGKVKNNNNFNELSNPLHNIDLYENEQSLNNEMDNKEADEIYKNLTANLYKKHGIELNKFTKLSKSIAKKKIKNDSTKSIEKSEKLNLTIEGSDCHKKFGNLKKTIPPLKNKNLINSNAIAKFNNLNSNNNNNFLINNLIKNKNLPKSELITEHLSEYNDQKSQFSSNKYDIMKESMSKLSFKSKISNNTTTSNKTNTLKNIELFSNDNKMTNLIKVRDQRKEFLKNKIGNKSNKRPDLFSFNTQHILINDKDEGYDKLFEIIQESKNKNEKDESFHPPTKSSNNYEVDKSIDSVNSKNNSVRKRIEQALSYSKNKIY